MLNTSPSFMTGLRFRGMVLVAFAVGLINTQGQPTRPSPPRIPAVAPLIARRYQEDRNGDRIHDKLAERAQRATATAAQMVSPSLQAEAEKQLAGFVELELIFTNQISQRQ